MKETTMTRNEAAHRVNEAFKDAKVVDAIKDPKAKSFAVEIDGAIARYEFRHGAHAHEQRKHEVAAFRLKLVEELVKHHEEPAFKSKAQDEYEQAEKAKKESEPEEAEIVDEDEGEPKPEGGAQE